MFKQPGLNDRAGHPKKCRLRVTLVPPLGRAKHQRAGNGIPLTLALGNEHKLAMPWQALCNSVNLAADH